MRMVRISFLGCFKVQGFISTLLLEYEFRSIFWLVVATPGKG